mmetsp:Transcript_60949/g.158389  ORF Transcript_60949/g.158389 Transcript_60949/m.158389 type:complete len:223 (-) Transcript_60949:38-706(-)
MCCNWRARHNTPTCHRASCRRWLRRRRASHSVSARNRSDTSRCCIWQGDRNNAPRRRRCTRCHHRALGLHNRARQHLASRRNQLGNGENRSVRGVHSTFAGRRRCIALMNSKCQRHLPSIRSRGGNRRCRKLRGHRNRQASLSDHMIPRRKRWPRLYPSELSPPDIDGDCMGRAHRNKCSCPALCMPALHRAALRRGELAHSPWDMRSCRISRAGHSSALCR